MALIDELVNVKIETALPAAAAIEYPSFKNVCIVTTVSPKSGSTTEAAFLITSADDISDYYEVTEVSSAGTLEMVDLLTTAFNNGSDHVAVAVIQQDAEYYYYGPGTNGKTETKYLTKVGDDYYYAGTENKYTATTAYYYLNNGEKTYLFKNDNTYYTDEACTVEYTGTATILEEPTPNVRYLSPDVATVLAKVNQYDFYFLTTSSDVSVDLYPDLATYVRAKECLFGINFYADGTAASADLEKIKALSDENKKRTVLFYTKTEGNKVFAVEAACVAMQNDPGSETWAYKTLTTTQPDSYTSAETLFTDDCYNLVSLVGGIVITLGGKTLYGEWIDVVRFRDWIKANIQIAVVGLLASQPKIPYTEDGIELVRITVEGVLDNGVAAGGIVPDKYDVTVPDYSALDAFKTSRVLPDVKFYANLTGAIHLVKIYGTITF